MSIQPTISGVMVSEQGVIGWQPGSSSELAPAGSWHTRARGVCGAVGNVVWSDH